MVSKEFLVHGQQYKYVKREWKNGKWHYIYAETKGDLKRKTGEADNETKSLDSGSNNAKSPSTSNGIMGEPSKEEKSAIADIMMGKLGNGQERIDKLTQMGLDVNKVQYYVNRQLLGETAAIAVYNRNAGNKETTGKTTGKTTSKMSNKPNLISSKNNKKTKRVLVEDGGVKYYETVENKARKKKNKNKGTTFSKPTVNSKSLKKK